MTGYPKISDLSVADEHALLARAQAQPQTAAQHEERDAARAEIVRLCRGMVFSYLHKLRVPVSDQEDAEQDGMVGLAEAIVRFRPSHGRFSTYAFFWIKQAVGRGRSARNPLREPYHMEEKRAKYMRLQDAHFVQHGRYAEPSEIAAAIGARRGSARLLTSPPPTVVSYDKPVGGEQAQCDMDRALLELVPDPAVADPAERALEGIYAQQARAALAQGLGELPDELRRVLELRHYQGDDVVVLRAIAPQLGITPQAADQRYRRALAALGRCPEIQALRETDAAARV